MTRRRGEPGRRHSRTLGRRVRERGFSALSSSSDPPRLHVFAGGRLGLRGRSPPYYGAAHGPSNTTEPLFMAALAVVFVLAGLVVIYLAWQRHRLSKANVASTCTITSSSLGYNPDSSRNAHWVAVTIEHEVGGKRYTSTDNGPTYASVDSSAAQRALRDFPVGRVMSCYYVAGNPDLVTVFPASRRGPPRSAGSACS